MSDEDWNAKPQEHKAQGKAVGARGICGIAQGMQVKHNPNGVQRYDTPLRTVPSPVYFCSGADDGCTNVSWNQGCLDSKFKPAAVYFISLAERHA